MYAKIITKILTTAGNFVAPDSIFKLEVQFLGKKEFSYCKIGNVYFALKADGSLWKIPQDRLVPERVTKKHFTHIAIQNEKLLALSSAEVVYEFDDEWNGGEAPVSEENFPENVEAEVEDSHEGFLFVGNGSEIPSAIPGHRFSVPQSQFFHVACKPLDSFSFDTVFGVFGPLQGHKNSQIRVSYAI